MADDEAAVSLFKGLLRGARGIWAIWGFVTSAVVVTFLHTIWHSAWYAKTLWGLALVSLLGFLYDHRKRLLHKPEGPSITQKMVELGAGATLVGDHRISRLMITRMRVL
jgi:hypothetical protein